MLQMGLFRGPWKCSFESVVMTALNCDDLEQDIWLVARALHTFHLGKRLLVIHQLVVFLSWPDRLG